MEEKPMIKIYDAIMGSGKTTRIINELKDLPDTTKFICVVPLLSECFRISGAKPSTTETGDIDYNVVECLNGTEMYDTTHKLYSKSIKHPSFANAEGSKLTGITNLIEREENIVTTHALFRSLTKEHLDLIKSKNYVLIIDEALLVYEEYAAFYITNPVKTNGAKTYNELPDLIRDGYIKIDEDGMTLRWIGGRLGRYNAEIDMCDRGSLLLIDNTFIIMELSVDILKVFKEVTIATYMFEGSYLDGYLQSHNLQYDLIKFGNSAKQFKDLITIYDNYKANNLSRSDTAFSSTSHRTNNVLMGALKTKLESYFRECSTVPEERLWTCYKDAMHKLKGKRYTKNFLSLSTKATNLYANTSVLAYTPNLYMNPYLVKMLARKDISVNEDRYALGEMVQWIYRSRIRNNQPITVYVPSSRMRELLIKWLNGDFD